MLFAYIFILFISQTHYGYITANKNLFRQAMEDYKNKKFIASADNIMLWSYSA